MSLHFVYKRSPLIGILFRDRECSQKQTEIEGRSMGFLKIRTLFCTPNQPKSLHSLNYARTAHSQKKSCFFFMIACTIKCTFVKLGNSQCDSQGLLHAGSCIIDRAITCCLRQEISQFMPLRCHIM